jgi:hypothetical protein
MTAPAAPSASFASADVAMDAAEAAFDYLAQLEVASLPSVTQARLLRGLERAESRHTAVRARVLSVFNAQCGYRDDGHGGPHSWLSWQTQVSARAASGAMAWVRRLAAHPVVGEALAAGTVSASFARKICEWAGMLPEAFRDAGAQILLDAAAAGAGLDELAGLAEDMFSRCARPDSDSEAEERRFAGRFFRLTRLFQGHGRADGDLTPECLAALTEVLDTLGKKVNPEDDRTAGQRRHDALEEAMRLLLASGCLPERAGQPAQVQLHMTLDDLLAMPGAADATRAWLADHLGTPPAVEQPADRSPADQAASDALGGDPGSCPDGAGPGLRRSRPGTSSPFAPDPQDLFSWPDPRAARSFAAGAGEPGWLTGKAAEAYSCDAKITPMVCGHLDRNAVARMVTNWLADDLANLVTSTDPVPMPGPRCTCEVHGAVPRAPILGALPTTGSPLPTTTGPVSPGPTVAPPGAVELGAVGLTSGGLARLQDTLLRYAVSLLSGPAGLAAYLRTQLTGGFFPSASLPLDLGQPTEQVPPHLRRAVIKRDRHCSFPGCTAPPVRCHVHHLIPRSQGGPTRLDNLTLLCAFHHLIAVHRWGWTLQLHADGTTTATSPDGLKTLHSHGPPPGQAALWADPPSNGPPATAA